MHKGDPMAGKNKGGAPLKFIGSRLFLSWMQNYQLSLAFTTYAAGKIFLVGAGKGDELVISERTLPRPMGINYSQAGTLWVSGQQQLWRFENFFSDEISRTEHDALFVPVQTRTTGDIDAHDMHVTKNGRPIFVATRFNCIATLDDVNSFKPIYFPPFIDRVAAEDRCHLNGVCLDGYDKPVFATAVAASNISEGWRDHRQDGGVIIDIKNNRMLASGLSMPHSPRLHNGKLYILNSGTGELGTVDLDNGMFCPICFIPGFARGMSINNGYAVITSSDCRKKNSFEDLALGTRLEKEKASPFVGIVVVNLKTGDIEHRLHIKGFIDEVYDCVVLSGVINPKILGFQSDETRFVIRPARFKS